MRLTTIFLLLALLTAPILAQRGGDPQQPVSLMPDCDTTPPFGACPAQLYFCLDTTTSVHRCKNDQWTAVVTAIGDEAITEAKLDVADTPADNECLKYQASSGRFIWDTCEAYGGDMLKSVYDINGDNRIDGLDGGVAANLPLSPGTYDVFLVTDDAVSGDCAGGGTANTACVWTGAAWEAFGGTGGAGGGGYDTVVTDSGTVSLGSAEDLSIVGGTCLSTTGVNGTPDLVTMNLGSSCLTQAMMSENHTLESEIATPGMLFDKVGVTGSKVNTNFLNGLGVLGKVPWFSGLSNVPPSLQDGDQDTFASVVLAALRSVRRNAANDGYEAYLPGDKDEANTWSMLQRFGVGVTLGAGTTDTNMCTTFDRLSADGTLCFNGSTNKFFLDKTLDITGDAVVSGTLTVGAVDVPAHATDGQCVTIKEGADDGSDSMSICVPDTGLSASKICVIQADGNFPDTCVGDGTDATGGSPADLNDITNVTLTTPGDGAVLCFTGTSNNSVDCTVGGDMTATEDSGTLTVTIGADAIGTAEVADGTLDEADLDASTNASLDLADSALQSETNNLTTAVAGLLPLANLTDDGTSNRCLVSGGGGGDPNWAACPAGSEANDVETDGMTGIAADELVLGTGAGTAVYGKISTLTDEPSPASGDLLLAQDGATGALRKIDINNLPVGGESNDLEATVGSVQDNEVFIGNGAASGTYLAFPVSQVPIFDGTSFVSSFVLFSGPTTSTKTFTLPDATSTILTDNAAVTVPQGGTGATSLTDGGILLGSGTGAVTALGVATNGQIPIGDGTTDPVLATITGTANEITVTSGAGSITIDIPDSPTLDGTNFSGIPSSAITTEVRSRYWPAGAISADGTDCSDPAEVTINSGPKTYTIACPMASSETNGIIYGSGLMPEGYDGGTFTLELAAYMTTDAGSGTLHTEAFAMCRTDDETIDSTWGTSIDIDLVTVAGDAVNEILTATSAAITGNGCAAGEMLFWKIEICDTDATPDGNCTSSAGLEDDFSILGVNMEYTSNVGDD